jgi:hypothetical protein
MGVDHATMSFRFLPGLCQSCIMICDLVLLDARLRTERISPTMVHNPPAVEAKACNDEERTIQLVESLRRISAVQPA